LTMLYCSAGCLCRGGACMKNLAHSASFHSGEKIEPSKSGIKQLGDVEIRFAKRLFGASAAPLQSENARNAQELASVFNPAAAQARPETPPQY
ncbi:hypothetical protein, partial [Vandammella animalimorsus]|uniref:hypothetical protein n=1 Tax=Vandammella animalimorsus TaxID=2029117 RepID=UPI001EEF251A